LFQRAVAPRALRHHRVVSADLQIDPIALRAVAALLPALRPSALDCADLDAIAVLPGGTALVAEHDRLTTAVTRAGDELADLTAVLTAVAAAAESAEAAAARVVEQR
jgi:hypothetical protein